MAQSRPLARVVHRANHGLQTRDDRMKGIIRVRRALDVLRREGPASFVRKASRVVSDRLLAHGPAEHLIVLESFRPHEPGMTMVDVGAATGNTLAAFVEAGWQVHAFEPDPANRAVLERIFGTIGSVRIDRRALSSRPANRTSFYTSAQSPGISSLVPFHDSHRQTEEVPVTTLANYLEEAGLDRIDFLKVDTEGSDLRVLQGHNWQLIQPKVVMCEFDDRKTASLGTKWPELAAFLQSAGYRVLVSEWQPLANYGSGHRWQAYQRFPCELADPAGWGNLIGVLDPAQMDRIERSFQQHARRK